MNPSCTCHWWLPTLYYLLGCNKTCSSGRVWRCNPLLKTIFVFVYNSHLHCVAGFKTILLFGTILNFSIYYIYFYQTRIFVSCFPPNETILKQQKHLIIFPFSHIFGKTRGGRQGSVKEPHTAQEPWVADP